MIKKLLYRNQTAPDVEAIPATYSMNSLMSEHPLIVVSYNQVVTATQVSHSSPLHTLPLTKDQDGAVWIYSGKYWSLLQASSHAVIRDTELMEKSISWSRVAWKGEETCLLQGLMSAATFNHQPTIGLSIHPSTGHFPHTELDDFLKHVQWRLHNKAVAVELFIFWHLMLER